MKVHPNKLTFQSKHSLTPPPSQSLLSGVSSFQIKLSISIGSQNGGLALALSPGNCRSLGFLCSYPVFLLLELQDPLLSTKAYLILFFSFVDLEVKISRAGPGKYYNQRAPANENSQIRLGRWKAKMGPSVLWWLRYWTSTSHTQVLLQLRQQKLIRWFWISHSLSQLNQLTKCWLWRIGGGGSAISTEQKAGNKN